jgi:hypothetical protein
MSIHIRVTVLSKVLHDAKVFAQNGKTYGRQNAAIFNGGDFPVPFNVNVEAGHEYEPGEYTIAPSSYRVDEMGNLKLKSTKLLPLGGSSAPKKL